jgi:TusA-related sulfurtransferase
MVEIGTECAAVLVRLNELMDNLPQGDIVHVVSDDPTAYVEMVRWAEQTGHGLIDWRKEENLFHFIVR